MFENPDQTIFDVLVKYGIVMDVCGYYVDVPNKQIILMETGFDCMHCSARIIVRADVLLSREDWERIVEAWRQITERQS